MDKPQPKTMTYYDYTECRNYLQEKYGYNERDFAGRHKVSWPENAHIPYLDFWHWVCEHHEVFNGCMIDFSREVLDDPDTDWNGEWQKEITMRFDYSYEILKN